IRTTFLAIAHSLSCAENCRPCGGMQRQRRNFAPLPPEIFGFAAERDAMTGLRRQNLTSIRTRRMRLPGDAMAEIIDGKRIAEEVLDKVRKPVTELTAAGTTTGLAVALVGEDPASQVYVA